MNQKPRDILEFLRRAGGGPPTSVEPGVEPEAEARHERFVAAPIAVEPVVSDDSGEPIVLTRRQAVIVGVVAVPLTAEIQSIDPNKVRGLAVDQTAAAEAASVMVEVVQRRRATDGNLPAARPDAIRLDPLRSS